MNKFSYETEPQTVAVAESAMAEWKRYQGKRGREVAMQALIALHMDHIRSILATQDIPPAMGGMFVTDVPEFDLSIVDANFPTLRERHVSLFTRKGVEVMMQLLQAGSGQKVQ